MFLILLIVFSLCLVTDISASDFIILNTETAESTLNWLISERNRDEIHTVANLPGNQIMEQLMMQKETEVLPFISTLDSFAERDSLPEPNYQIAEALSSQKEITQLLNYFKDSDFSKDLVSRATKYFPKSWDNQRNFQIFFVVTGWKWGDAMTFHYNQENGQYLLSNKGTPGIIINLTIVCQTYGETTEQRINALKKVMSHELFHAKFSDFSKDYWNKTKENSFSDEVITLMLNEGLAHYIAYGSDIAQVYVQSQNIKEMELKAFEMLNSKAEIIFDESLSLDVRRKAVNEGTYGQFWDKYLCITGLFMVYHIEQEYGIEGVTQCLTEGGEGFIKLYNQLSHGKSKIPKLPKKLKPSDR